MANERTIQPGANGGVWQQERPKTADDDIVADIRQALFAGRLKPGEQLGSERKLSVRYGVSRVTIRDALRVLETSGIVEIRLGAAGGVRIAQPDPRRFADALAVQFQLSGMSRTELIDAQWGIEVTAARQAATEASKTDVARLRACIEQVRAMAGTGAPFTKATREFHLALVEASHNRILVSLFVAIRPLWEASLPSVATPQIVKRVVSYYENVVHAIERQDGARAGAEVEKFLRRNRMMARRRR